MEKMEEKPSKLFWFVWGCVFIAGAAVWCTNFRFGVDPTTMEGKISIMTQSIVTDTYVPGLFD